MAQIPSIQDIYNKIKSSVFSNTNGELQVEKDPFAQAFASVISALIHDAYRLAQDEIAQTFAQNSTTEGFLLANAFDKTGNEIKRRQPQFAKGKLTITASQQVDIPAGTEFISDEGEIYQSLSTRSCTNTQILIQSLQRVSNYATAIVDNHLLGNGMEFTISGANELGFNGIQKVEILSENSFRFPNTGIDQVATGTIIGSYLGCVVDVESIDQSESANKDFSEVVNLASSIDYVQDVYITFDGIFGGTDIEDLISFQERIVFSLGFPQNKGNLFQHSSYIREKTDANFVSFFTEEDPENFYLKSVISKMDDNFSFINFSTQELIDIRNKFILDNQVLLGIIQDNVSFDNPIFININISINGLSPNTIDMRNAINNGLKEYIAILPIKKYLNGTELTDDKIKQVLNIIRDSSGNNPSYASLLVNGASGLDTNIKKPILGVVTYA